MRETSYDSNGTLCCSHCNHCGIKIAESANPDDLEPNYTLFRMSVKYDFVDPNGDPTLITHLSQEFMQKLGIAVFFPFSRGSIAFGNTEARPVAQLCHFCDGDCAQQYLADVEKSEGFNLCIDDTGTYIAHHPAGMTIHSVNVLGRIGEFI